MPTNFVSEGNYIDYTPGSAVTAGDVVVLGSVVAVATHDIAASALGAVAVEGVFDFPKATTSGSAIAVGLLVYWDASGGVITTTAGSNKKAGYTVETSADADTYQKVKLCQET